MSTGDYVIDAENAWIETFSGGKFHILKPCPDEIKIEDVAHALGMMTRFTGHSKFFYSVGEHCFHASFLVPDEHRMWALLHDAPEAYIADISRPLKHMTAVGKEYLAIEQRIMNAICLKFNLPLEQPSCVKEADNAMLYAEKEQLMSPLKWDFRWAENPTPADVLVQCWSPEEAKKNFLRRYWQIKSQIERKY